MICKWKPIPYWDDDIHNHKRRTTTRTTSRKCGCRTQRRVPSTVQVVVVIRRIATIHYHDCHPPKRPPLCTDTRRDIYDPNRTNITKLVPTRYERRTHHMGKAARIGVVTIKSIGDITMPVPGTPLDWVPLVLMYTNKL